MFIYWHCIFPHVHPFTPFFYITVAISALVVAQKVWDDTPLINADFSILYPPLTVKEINFLERKFLDLLEFKVRRTFLQQLMRYFDDHLGLRVPCTHLSVYISQLTVSPSLYAQYYFELRSICEENMQLSRPYSLLDRRMEVRYHLSEVYQKKKKQYKEKTMTAEDIDGASSRVVIN